MSKLSGNHFLFLAFALLLTAGLLFATGCEDDPADPVIETGGIELPLKLSELMKNFEISYKEMRIDIFNSLLHEDFEMILLSSTLVAWDWPEGKTFDKAEMELIHQHIFSGLPGSTADGNPVHPVDTIVVELLEQQNDWSDISAENPYFGGQEGELSNFQIWLQFWDAANEHKYEIQQEAVFYVAPVTVDGKTYYQFLGIRLLPQYEKNAQTSWCSLLSLYY